MLDQDSLKEKLQKIAGNEFRLAPGDDLNELLPAMLTYIGATDSELRDDLIYSAFAAWIYKDNLLEPEQLRGLLNSALDERHLFYGLGQQGADSVFTRTFSVLLLPLVLISHRARPFLSADEVRQVKTRLLDYLSREKDLRGYVPVKGWAHAAAHSADALDDLAQCVELDPADLAEILAAARQVMCQGETGFIHLEEERMVTAVLAVLRRAVLPEAEVAAWIEGFAGRVLGVKDTPQRLVVRSNAKSFLQSLLLRLHWQLNTQVYDAVILRVLRQITPFVPQEEE
jgi:hypothetical protein